MGTEPDVHLLKQVEQVTILVLEGPARRFARIPSIGIKGAAEVLVFITAIVGFGCYFAAETARGGRGRPFAKGGPATLPAPPGGSNEPGHWPSEALARQIR
jgi:hypothetical protein